MINEQIIENVIYYVFGWGLAFAIMSSIGAAAVMSYFGGGA